MKSAVLSFLLILGVCASAQAMGDYDFDCRSLTSRLGAAFPLHGRNIGILIGQRVQETLPSGEVILTPAPEEPIWSIREKMIKRWGDLPADTPIFFDPSKNGMRD